MKEKVEKIIIDNLIELSEQKKIDVSQGLSKYLTNSLDVIELLMALEYRLKIHMLPDLGVEDLYLMNVDQFIIWATKEVELLEKL
jgi:acyl carrier protein